MFIVTWLLTSYPKPFFRNHKIANFDRKIVGPEKSIKNDDFILIGLG